MRRQMSGIGRPRHRHGPLHAYAVRRHHYTRRPRHVRMLGIFSQFERQMIVACVNAGLARDTITRDGHFIS